jgi:hypothetical protein
MNDTLDVLLDIQEDLEREIARLRKLRDAKPRSSTPWTYQDGKLSTAEYIVRNIIGPRLAKALAAIKNEPSIPLDELKKDFLK